MHTNEPDARATMRLHGIRGWLTGAGVLLAIATIGLIDLNTGRQYSFSVLYVLPTATAAWYLGRGAGLVTSALSGLAWGVTDYLIRTSNLDATMWNGLIRVATFIALAYLVDALRYFLETLRRSQNELQELLTQRDQFLSLMAHELRAPVAAIEIVATGLSGTADLGGRERRAISQLLRQARSLSSLAQGVLTASQLEAGTIELDPESFDLRDVVGDATEGEPRVQVRMPEQPVVVVADRDAILRAVTNLITNALKFSRPEHAVAVVLRREQAAAVIEVTDSGVGLTADESARLFQKYARIRVPETSRIEGVGLGLYFTRLILEAHGGSVNVKSLGRNLGSTFTLRLPILEAATPDLPSRETVSG